MPPGCLPASLSSLRGDIGATRREGEIFAQVHLGPPPGEGGHGAGPPTVRVQVGCSPEPSHPWQAVSKGRSVHKPPLLQAGAVWPQAPPRGHSSLVTSHSPETLPCLPHAALRASASLRSAGAPPSSACAAFNASNSCLVFPKPAVSQLLQQGENKALRGRRRLLSRTEAPDLLFAATCCLQLAVSSRCLEAPGRDQALPPRPCSHRHRQDGHGHRPPGLGCLDSRPLSPPWAPRTFSSHGWGLPLAARTPGLGPYAMHWRHSAVCMLSPPLLDVKTSPGDLGPPTLQLQDHLSPACAPAWPCRACDERTCGTIGPSPLPLLPPHLPATAEASEGYVWPGASPVESEPWGASFSVPCLSPRLLTGGAAGQGPHTPAGGKRGFSRI